MNRAASRCLVAGLVGYALTAPFSLTAGTLTLLVAMAGAAVLWAGGETPNVDSSVGWAVIVYLAVKLVTGILAYDPQAGVQEFFHLWPWLLFWVVPLSVHTGPRVTTLHKVLACSVAVVSLYAIFQNVTGTDIWRDSRLPYVFGRYPALAFFDNQQTWAGFALACALYLGTLALQRSGSRWLFAAAGAVALLGAVASQIRGTLVGLGAGFGVWFWGSVKSARLAWVALALTVVALTLSPGTLIRFNEIKDRSLNLKVDISRLYIWKTSWEIGAARPLLGAGPGNFADAYERTKDRPEARTMGHAHNEWFHEWATSGAPGLLAFSWLVFVVGRALWRLRQSGAMPALAAWVGLAGSALFQCQFSDDEVLMLAVFLAAVGLLSGPPSADIKEEGKAA